MAESGNNDGVMRLQREGGRGLLGWSSLDPVASCRSRGALRSSLPHTPISPPSPKDSPGLRLNGSGQLPPGKPTTTTSSIKSPGVSNSGKGKSDTPCPCSMQNRANA